jgi:CBS domain containing-hemolysin-like protein
MPVWLELSLIIALFLAGLRLSAFFSGSETAYYRMSLPRVMIDAQAGDKTSRFLQSLARRPSQFMASMLVGNNIANYLITVALGWFVSVLGFSGGMRTEITATLCSAPLIFVCGELLPKSLYYRAPLHFLRRDVIRLRIASALLLPASWPLHLLTQLLERMRPTEGPSLEVLLGRNRLAQVMTHGHREGVLTESQIQLATGLLQIAPQAIVASMIPADRVFGVDAAASREQIVDFAKRYGVSQVAVHRPGHARDWFAYVNVAEVAIENRPLDALLHALPVISPTAGKLEALQQLRAAGAALGVVRDQHQLLGLVNYRGLAEQLFRPVAKGVSGFSGGLPAPAHSS